jgi:hypothetical protein
LEFNMTLGKIHGISIPKYVDRGDPSAAGGFEWNHGAVLTVSGTYSGETRSVTVDDASSAVSSLLYIAADFNYDRALATAAATMPGVVLALAAGAGAKLVLTKGQICNTAWDWSAGLIYASDGSAGALTQTAPAASAEIVQVVGYAMSADTMWFEPSLVVYAVP